MVLLVTMTLLTFAVEAQDVATVVVEATTGGTTSPPVGTYNYAEGTRIKLRATANEGYEFRNWVISGAYTPGHNQAPVIIPADVSDQFIPNIPALDRTGVDNVVIGESELDVICGYGYTFTYRAVFSPVSTGPTENEATVVVESALGGTTSPPAGTYTYPENTVFTLKATPNEGFVFQNWIISGNYVPLHNQPPLLIPAGTDLNDPDLIPNLTPNLPPLDRSGIDNLVVTDSELNVLCGYGYTFTYQPVFVPAVGGSSGDAVVVVKDAVGGSTNPQAGTYTYGEGSTITLIATPDANYEFKYWIISGNYVPLHNQPPLILPPGIDPTDTNQIPDLPAPDQSGIDNLVVTDSELNVICGYGYTFTYQPIFAPTSANVPSPSEPEGSTEGMIHPPLGLSAEAIVALIAILAIVVVIAVLFGFYMWRRNKK